jgi:hypothetical protein
MNDNIVAAELFITEESEGRGTVIRTCLCSRGERG